MSIDDYIESLTNLNKDNRTIAWLSNENVLSLCETERLVFHSKLGNALCNIPHQLDLKTSADNKNKIINNQANSWRDSSVQPRNEKATDLELNRFNTLKKCFKEVQEQYIKVAPEESSNESDQSYITAVSSSESGSSYFTVINDFTFLIKANDNLKSEISFDSGIDEGKKDLIMRLLQSKGDDFLEEEFLIDCPPTLYETEDLPHDVKIEQKCWNEDISEQLMYNERIFRFVQSTDVEDSSQKEFPVIKSSRQYFMNLSDEHFSEFEVRKSLDSMSLSLGED